MKKHTCFRCGKEIVVGIDKYMMVPIEIPYMNLFFHKAGCYTSYDEVINFLKENADKIFKYEQK